jgi:membrane dipeptidase
LVFGTVMTRIAPEDHRTQTGMYSQSQCYGIGQGHAAYYRALEREGALRIIRSLPELDRHVAAWQEDPAGTPIGLVLSMEGADSIMDPGQVEEWRKLGLRMASISHYGTGAYAHGTGTQGGLFPGAVALLRELKAAGIIVDLTHLTDQGFWELLERYDGPVAASHHNCRALVPGQRQLTDEMIRAVAERGGVIGVVLDAWMLDPEWKQEVPACDQRVRVTLDNAADHLEHIIAVTGSTNCCGIGSDLDGWFGQEESPADLNTIADLSKIAEVLRKRGHADAEVSKILHGNWLRLLRETWPA